MDKSEIITCQSYRDLVDFNYHCGNLGNTVLPKGIIPPDKSIVHCHPDELQDFFKTIKDTKNRYILVSSCSDFGPCFQRQYPVWADAPKWLQMQASPLLKYDDVHMPARCDKNRCNLNDMYSIKCYSWTHSTFPKIPDSIVKWFVTNNLLEDYSHEHIVTIPFGIGPGTEELFANITEEQKQNKTKLLYVNFSVNTLERYQLKTFYSNMASVGVTCIRDTNLSKAQYIQDLLDHQFVLCPCGNGIDSYRVLEAIYCGCIPIVDTTYTFKGLSSLPIWRMSNLFDVVDKLAINRKLYMETSSLKMSTLSYWREQIEEARKLL
jgi:hypothetical protein